MNEKKEKLIHVGKFTPFRQGTRYLLLRERTPRSYVWFEEDGNGEKSTEVDTPSPEEAMREAYRKWRHSSFRMLHCGFRYTLPERDEHGMNALFHQMVASYSIPSGVYFDSEAGHLCHVQFASKEALGLWHRLREQNRLYIQVNSKFGLWAAPKPGG